MIHCILCLIFRNGQTKEKFLKKLDFDKKYSKINPKYHIKSLASVPFIAEPSINLESFKFSFGKKLTKTGVDKLIKMSQTKIMLNKSITLDDDLLSKGNTPINAFQINKISSKNSFQSPPKRFNSSSRLENENSWMISPKMNFTNTIDISKNMINDSFSPKKNKIVRSFVSIQENILSPSRSTQNIPLSPYKSRKLESSKRKNQQIHLIKSIFSSTKNPSLNISSSMTNLNFFSPTIQEQSSKSNISHSKKIKSASINIRQT